MAWITYDGNRLEARSRGVDYDPTSVKPTRNLTTPPPGRGEDAVTKRLKTTDRTMTAVTVVGQGGVMRALVLGGSVFVGKRLVQALVAGGHDVSVLNRGKTPTELPEGVGHLRG